MGPVTGDEIGRAAAHPSTATAMSWPRAFAAWCALAVLMIVNGTLREWALTPLVGGLPAHQISSVTGSMLIVLASFVLVPWIGAGSRSDAIRLGSVWLATTILFESGFGHYVAGHPWSALLADYDLGAGRLWTLVLVTTAGAPWLVVRSRNRADA